MVLREGGGEIDASFLEQADLVTTTQDVGIDKI